MNTYIKKEEKFQVSNLTLHPKELGKKEQTRPKFAKERIIEIRAEINEIEKQLNQS